jgi:hypothetical protein
MSLLGKLVKTALGVGVVYAAYKIGQRDGKNKERDALKEARTDLEMEIEYMEGLVKDYDSVPNKTQKDWDNKQMLEMKLDLLKRKL